MLVFYIMEQVALAADIDFVDRNLVGEQRWVFGSDEEKMVCREKLVGMQRESLVCKETLVFEEKLVEG